MREASCMIKRRLEVGFQQVLQGTMLFTYLTTNLLLLFPNNFVLSHILQFSMRLASDFIFVVRETLICIRLIPSYTLKHMAQFHPVRYKGKLVRKLLRKKKKMFAPKRKSQEKNKIIIHRAFFFLYCTVPHGIYQLHIATEYWKYAYSHLGYVAKCKMPVESQRIKQCKIYH